MKKALLALLVAGVMATVASLAVAQEATSANSANAVGVVKYTIPGNNELICVNLPLWPMDGATNWLWPETDVAKQLPNGSVVYFWNETGWESSAKGSRGWSKTGATKQLGIGDAFFIKGQADEQTVSLLGELPTEDDLPCTVYGNGVLVTRGVSMYPVGGKFATSALASNLPSGSIVYFWDNADGWQSSAKGSRGWSKIGATNEFSVGQGIFVKSASDATLSLKRPFEW